MEPSRITASIRAHFEEEGVEEIEVLDYDSTKAGLADIVSIVYNKTHECRSLSTTLRYRSQIPQIPTKYSCTKLVKIYMNRCQLTDECCE